MTDTNDWLADANHPSLETPIAARLDDPALPDRLTWNTFHTLSQWNTDVWVPRFLEVALGEDNALVECEWGEASVDVWRSGLELTGSTDVVIDGPDAVVLVEATFLTDLGADHLAVGADAALGLPQRADSGKPAAFVLVRPSLDDANEAERLQDELAADLLDLPEGEGHGLREEALEHIAGWLTWADVGALAVDIAEESDPLRQELVHRLVTQLQARFPGIDV
ncbi:MAG TPA: hypothetical protein VFK42_04900 [Acidimicrobiales bacterium]|nr:hypothetical protein [Acidimicrobiales bacterium]